MRCSLSIIVALIASGVVAGANPIAVMRGFELTGADVTVNVYRSESRIEGDYTFRTTKYVPHKGEFVDYTVIISLPVILPTNGVIIKEWPGPKYDQKKLLFIGNSSRTRVLFTGSSS